MTGWRALAGMSAASAQPAAAAEEATPAGAGASWAARARLYCPCASSAAGISCPAAVA